MKHSEYEDLLAAYALDAVEPDEAGAIEEHLSACARCRAEIAQHREISGLLGSSRVDVPPGLWERLAASLSDPAAAAPAEAEIVPLAGRPSLSRAERYRARWRRSVLPYGAAALGAAAAAVVAVLSVQVSHLKGEVRTLQADRGLAQAVAAAVAGPHREITLASASTSAVARVIVAADGDAYWVGASLPVLPRDETYQVWSTLGGSKLRLVSIDVVGPDPSAISAFRLDQGVRELLVTIEPAGGVAAPTRKPLVTAAV